MPFVRVATPNRKMVNEIRIGNGRILVAENLALKYLLKNKRVKLFIDKENRLVGIKSDKDGDYSINKYSKQSSVYRFASQALDIYKVKKGRYPAIWSKKHQMIIATIKFEEEE